MKHLKNLKVFIPLLIVLAVLGIFTATTMTSGSSMFSGQAEHGHAH